MNNAAFSLPVRVYYADTDAGGVVYHANYLAYMERARNEWLRELGYPVTEVIGNHDLAFVARSVKLDYRAPARLDDLLAVTAKVVMLGNSSMTIHQQVWCDDTLLVEAELVMVVVDVNSFRPRRIPAFLRQLVPGQAGDK